MKRLLLLASAIVLMVGCSSKAELRVATYNIRYDAAADAKGGDSWAERKGAVAEMIKSHDFDIVGTQEGDARQIEELSALLPEYDHTGHPYGGAKGDAHTATICYKGAKMELLDEGTFWYSPTPEVESIGWDATDLRLCHWGKFRERSSGKEFYFLDSHLYWRLKEAKANSGKVHIEMIGKITEGKPVVSVGDFNSGENTPQVGDILSLLKDSRALSESAPQGCFDTNLGGGNFIGPAKGRIDYIFVSPQIRVKDYAVLEDKRENGHYPSDHLPIVCNVEF